MIVITNLRHCYGCAHSSKKLHAKTLLRFSQYLASVLFNQDQHHNQDQE